jgi:hypothetical protein
MTLKMTLKQQTKYPSRRAYVLKIRSDAKPEAREFASGEELLDSIASDLEAPADEPSIRPEGA